MRLTHLSILVATLLAVSACGGSAAPASTPDGAGAPASPSQNPVPSASTSGGSSAASVEITLGTDAGTELKFEPAALTAGAGTHVRVTFENRASVPHNLTFQAPIEVATSTTVAPGTSEVVEFTAPAAGEYTFVCTLHPGMAGTLDIDGP
jgi:plastocyanin